MSGEAEVDLGAYSVRVKSGWLDMTDELEGEPRPWTLARSDGVGALQFSHARYVSGPVPNPSAQDLAEMVRDFGRKRGLAEPEDLTCGAGSMRIAGGSYRWEESFLRIWYVSDGRSFVFVTYAAEDVAAEELADCEEMVATIRFPMREAGGRTRG